MSEHLELGRFAEMVIDEHGLVVVSTARRDGSVLSSVVNAGVMRHPITGAQSVAFVSGGRAARLAHIRRGAPVTVVARRGWQWSSIAGRADVIGPDDPADRFVLDDLPQLLRTVFVAAGGTHDDWEEYDRVMREDRRAAVFVSPDRTIGNG